ncbi:MAG: DUF2851 family protein [Bacteroidota bacterium]
MSIKEDLLHYIWRTKRFEISSLQTTTGESIEIQDFGKHNPNAGPDFLNAKVKIGDTLWAGNVEMHINSSDWIKHQHNKDRAYDNVILHVVLEEDLTIYRGTGEVIPCLELRKKIPLRLANTYQKLKHNEHWIPCQHHFYEVNDMTKNMWLDRMMVERLELKTKMIELELARNNNDWEETFYWFLARNFGVKVNAEPFEWLAKSLPLKILAKHKNNLHQVEALLFGQAGLLNESLKDEYPQSLLKEYEFLKQKHRLQPIAGVSWKFMRLRPANFPTIRIAQFATLIHQSIHLFSKILEADTIEQIEQLFRVKLSDYWSTHYVFDKISTERNKSLGRSTIHLLIINTIAPFLFFYGSQRGVKEQCDKALRLLDQLPPESNTIISGWKQLGMLPRSAYDTQALIQLKNNFCNANACLDCAIGNAILK